MEIILESKKDIQKIKSKEWIHFIVQTELESVKKDDLFAVYCWIKRRKRLVAFGIVQTNDLIIIDAGNKNIWVDSPEPFGKQRIFKINDLNRVAFSTGFGEFRNLTKYFPNFIICRLITPAIKEIVI